MRYLFALPRRAAVTLAVCTTLAGLLSVPALAAPAAQHGAAHTTPARKAPPPTGSTAAATDQPAVQTRPLTTAQLPPLKPTPSHTRHATEAGPKRGPKPVSCTPADFARRTGPALVTFVEASTTGCVNTLFAVTGTNAGDIFRQSRMVTVAKAFTREAQRYRGDNSYGVWQLVLFLRAGYYVQFNHPSDVGPYGAPLAQATTRGLDAFFANRHSRDVGAANGDVLGETVILTDSADQQARYLTAYQRLLNAYDSSYDAVPSMLNAVNDVYTPLWRGNWNPDYVSAVTADPGIARTLQGFALQHLDLLGTDRAYLDSNAGMNVARYVEHAALRPTVQPLAKDLLNASKITGPMAGLWVAVATQADYYDRPDCSYYDICGLSARLTDAALPLTHTCDATHTVRAQALTSAELDAVCANLSAQDPYFHDLVEDDGPIPGQYLSTVQLVVFASRADYQTYA
ncbi:MAG: collagenase, partial [Streptomyces sp.]|nr:collagenase [Streptomyces sp.]